MSRPHIAFALSGDQSQIKRLDDALTLFGLVSPFGLSESTVLSKTPIKEGGENDKTKVTPKSTPVKKRPYEPFLPALARGMGSFDIDYLSATYEAFENPALKKRRVILPAGDSYALPLRSPFVLPRVNRNIDKDSRLSLRPLGSGPGITSNIDQGFEGKSWIDQASMRLFAVPKGGLEALIDDEVDDAEVAYERISSWLRCLVSLDDRVRRQLERDLAHPLYLAIRKTPNRGDHLSSDEAALIDRYKASYPFGIMITYALSIVLNRPYERIRDHWLEKITVSPTTTLQEVRSGIQLQLGKLQAALQRSSGLPLGSLSSTLLQLSLDGFSARKTPSEVQASMRLALSDSQALNSELSSMHRSLVVPNRASYSSQVVSAEEALLHLQRDEFGLGSHGRIQRILGMDLSVEPPNLNFNSIHASLPDLSSDAPPPKEKQTVEFKKPEPPPVPKRRPGRPRKTPLPGTELPFAFYPPVQLEPPPSESSPMEIVDSINSNSNSSELIDGYLDPKHVVSWDVSQGTSRLRLRCVNQVDDEKFPSNIKFLARRFFADEAESDESLAFTPGCNCSGNCKDSPSCTCVSEMHQHRSPYNDSGCLTNWPIGYPIYECNSNCSCGASCRNRVVQHGSLAPIEIFKTKEKGWGVRATKPIPAGTFVCEYIGEIVNAEEAEKRGLLYDSIQCSYLFDLDMDEGECRYTIDAFYYGNVSRFINHCCDPNLLNYQVWIDNLDKAKPHVCLYARRDIKALEEISFDYKYEVLKAAKGEMVEHIKCMCGARNCRGVLF